MTIVLVSSALVTQFYLSISQYKQDKIAYVFDTALQSSNNVALMVSSDVKNALQKVRLILKRPLSPNYQIPRETNKFLVTEENISGFYITKRESNNNFSLTSTFSKNAYKPESEWVNQVSQKALLNNFFITRSVNSDHSWILAVPIIKQENREVIAIAEFEQANFIGQFYEPKLQNYYLLNENNELVFQPVKPAHDLSEAILQTITGELSVNPQGAQEEVNAGPHSFVKSIKIGDEVFLVASSLVNTGNYRVLSLIPEAVALEALAAISINTGLLVLFLLGIAIMVSVIGASTLTSNLSKLYQAMNKIIKGELNTKVDIRSRDEVGVLATGFNLMTDKIQELLHQTAEKARMEGELKTARTVQSTLFPKDHFENQSLEIFGFYEPASECGGDWYSYSIFDDRAYFWIGDATGHGVSAALITSAAKSASAIIQTLPHIKTSEIMNLMNTAVGQTSGGNVLMTFFVGCLEYQTGKFTYTNASHDTPYLFKKLDKYKRKDIHPMMGETGSRIGQDLTSTYVQNQMQLEPGDRIVFYTDGLPEITDQQGQQWGEGKFLRSLVKSFNDSKKIKTIAKSLLNEAYEFRGEEILHDDVTFFIFEYKGSANVV